MNKAKAIGLLERYKSIREIAMASEKELMDTSGIGKVLAKRIAEIMRRDYIRH